MSSRGTYCEHVYPASGSRPSLDAVGAYEDLLLENMRGPAARHELSRRSPAKRRLTAAQRQALAEVGAPAHSACLYVELLGPPLARGRCALADGPFAGSTWMAFKLPTWPRRPFVVNQHPDGWAWLTGFVRPTGCSQTGARRPFAPVVWQTTLDELSNSDIGDSSSTDADQFEIVDGWDHWTEVVIGPLSLRFDYRLLQDVRNR